jgi:K+-dependent Na+/Ca+ exchanger-like protein
MDVILSLLAIAVVVYLLAIVTEEFFVVSLDKIATRLEMPSDVAGASLMAVGSSAPELFIALFAVIIGGDHANVGIGTIVGSAVFNILVITGASAIVAKRLIVEADSVQRDVFFYLFSVTLLLLVFWNGQILYWEIFLLLGAYVVYLVILWRWGDDSPKEREAESSHSAEMPVEQVDSLLEKLNVLMTRFFRLFLRNPEQQYVWAMLSSVALIAFFSYILVEAAVIFAAGVGIPPVIVAVTLLAAGTSAPDLIASVSVAREGRGTLAIANAVGSNIFDVLVGLGLPWLVLLIFSEPNVVEVGTEGLLVSIVILCVTVLLLYVVLYIGQAFTRREGFLLIGAYILYVAYEVIASTGLL